MRFIDTHLKGKFVAVCEMPNSGSRILGHYGTLEEAELMIARWKEGFDIPGAQLSIELILYAERAELEP